MLDPYHVDTVRSWVWSGFYTSDELRERTEELVEDEGEPGDRPPLLNALAVEQSAKTVAEASWPAVTDCDRLDAAFDALNAAGIVALQHAGYTMSDGLYDVTEAADDLPAADRQGWAFYHGQDTESAVAGHGVWIAFGAYLDGDATASGLWQRVVEAVYRALGVSRNADAAHVAVGHRVADALRNAGLAPDWDGDPATRICVPMDWKRRSPPETR